MSSLQILQKENTEGDLVILFTGQINEDSDFSSLETLEGQKLILDLDGITHINSCGIRDLIEFQKSNFKFDAVIYKNCPQVIVEQMNIVSGFIHPNGVVESFYAPYFNQAKDNELKILIFPSEVVGGKAPVKKDDDGNELEFDDIEAQYFNFLKG